MNITERPCRFPTSGQKLFRRCDLARFQQHVIDAEDATIKPVFCEDSRAAAHPCFPRKAHHLFRRTALVSPGSSSLAEQLNTSINLL